MSAQDQAHDQPQNSAQNSAQNSDQVKGRVKGEAREPVENLRRLIRCPSVTPSDAGALAALSDMLTPLGFSVERVTAREAGTPDIDNLYARLGTSGPHLMFAGHTDVVPVGDEAAWSHPPFAAEIADGAMFGRGAVDMKGGIACFVAADRKSVV